MQRIKLSKHAGYKVWLDYALLLTDRLHLGQVLMSGSAGLHLLFARFVTRL
jgi:hypothetical protein